jgi:serine/threonine protein kinase
MFKHHEGKGGPKHLFPVPEQFLWYVFECLCIAGLVLEHGEMERNPMGNWTSIAHRDMKLSNVFLSLPSETKYRCYPVPKLGDFGLAIFLPGGQASDQDVRGTPDNMPVEQDPWAMNNHGVSWPITSKTNVWGIANIVASLLTQKEGFGDWDRFQKYKEAVWYDGELAMYSDELRKAIEECIRFDPNDRPDLTHVLNNIRARRMHPEDVSLPIAPAYSPVWSKHRIDAEILDLVCTL